MSLTIHFMRHFQTPCSTAGVYCSDCPTGLTDKGIAMATALARHRGQTPWQAIYASTLPRAQKSAEPVAQARQLPVNIVPGIEELRYGRWENATREAARSLDADFFARWEHSPASLAPPSGETATQVAHRAGAAVERLRALHPDGDILVVSHKGTLRILLCALLGIDLNLYRSRLAQPLGGMTEVAFLPSGPQLRTFADNAYLPEDLRHLQ